MEKELKYNLDLSPASRWNMIAASPNSKANLLYLQETGDFYAGPNYYTTRVGFDSYLIKLTLDGGGILSYGGETYSVPSGQFYWIDCQKWHDYRTDPDFKSWHIIWVHFNGPSAKYYYDTFLANNGNKPVGTFSYGSSGAYSSLLSIMEISSQKGNQPELDFAAAGMLSTILADCISSSSRHPGSHPMPANIQTAKLYLEKHYREKTTLEDLGLLTSMNPHYLQKLFKRHVGMSPTEYLIYLRITKAKKLMRTTHLSIGEIASDVGLDNRNYFTRLFRSQEGVTPHEYRNLWPIIESSDTEKNSIL